MRLATRVTLGLGTFAGACGLVALIVMGAPAAQQSVPAPPPTACTTTAALTTTTTAAAITTSTPAFSIATDHDPDAEELGEVVTRWLDGTGAMPNLDRQRGVVFVRGSEQLYEGCGYTHLRPREATHACGSPARWLRDALRSSLRDQTIHCSARACTYTSTQPFAPTGTMQFRLDDGIWTLTAWTELYPNEADATLVRDNLAWAARTVRAMSRTRCAGATPGSED